jgi:hypothetical protein|tara:strand:+ start:4492 stop:5244 length:753 start_codon:yes stop_codon:yes gene_type:complete
MTSNKSAKQRYLYVSTPIIQRYNATASWVFAYVAYFAVRGGYNTKKSWPSLVKKYTGISPKTYKQHLQTFVDDDILINKDGVYSFNEENVLFNDVFDSYKNNEFKTLSLVEVNPHSTNKKNMTGKKALHERLAVTIEAIALNIAASSKELSNKEPSFELSSYAWLARELGADYRTIQAVIKTISFVRKTFDSSRNVTGKILLQLRKTSVMSLTGQVEIYKLKLQRYKAKKERTTRSFTDRFKNNKYAHTV